MINANVTVVLPAAMHGRVRDPELLRWLSRGQLSVVSPPVEALLTVLELIGARDPGTALAALRYQGQRGELPAGWLAAADPVHLETRLRDLRIHAFWPGEVSAAELQAICSDFDGAWGTDSSYRLEVVGSDMYVSGEPPFDTALVSAQNATGQVPDAMHTTCGATAERNCLLSELQMFLHEHPVNLRRAESGLPAINSFWFWGAGEAQRRDSQPLPSLYADDPLFRGYWMSGAGETLAWPGDLDACLGGEGDVVVVTPPAASPGVSDDLHDYLSALRMRLVRGDMARVMLVFRDGLVVGVGRQHRFRIWQRRISPYLQAAFQDV